MAIGRAATLGVIAIIVRTIRVNIAIAMLGTVTSSDSIVVVKM